MTLICIAVADRDNLEIGINFLEDLLKFTNTGMFNFNPAIVGC